MRAVSELRTRVIGQMTVWLPLFVSLCLVDLRVFNITLITGFVDSTSTNA